MYSCTCVCVVNMKRLMCVLVICVSTYDGDAYLDCADSDMLSFDSWVVWRMCVLHGCNVILMDVVVVICHMLIKCVIDVCGLCGYCVVCVGRLCFVCVWYMCVL